MIATLELGLNTLRKNRIPDLLAQRDNMSIYELAKKIGRSYNATHSLVKAESIPGGTTYDTLRRIASVLGVSIEDLEIEE